jgi:microcystin-dependent protein
MCVVDPLNKPTGSIRWNRTTLKFQEWNGSAWVDINVSGGLTLGTMASQNSNNVFINGGNIVQNTNIDAACLTSGLVNPARIAGGAASPYTLLCGDQQWRNVGIGTIIIWPMDNVPNGYLHCSGQAVSRVTYSILFSILGGYYGAGDGGSTFNLPNMTGYFPYGKNYVGGNGFQIGVPFGSLDHTHIYRNVVEHGHYAYVNDPGHTHPMKLQSDPGPRARVAVSYMNANSPVLIDDAEDTIQLRYTGISVAVGSAIGGIDHGTTEAANPPGFPIHFMIKAL